MYTIYDKKTIHISNDRLDDCASKDFRLYKGREGPYCDRLQSDKIASKQR